MNQQTCNFTSLHVKLFNVSQVEVPFFTNIQNRTKKRNEIHLLFNKLRNERVRQTESFAEGYFKIFNWKCCLGGTFHDLLLTISMKFNS